MLIRLYTKMGHIVKHACLMFCKIYRAVLKIFAKALKFKNYHKIITRMILEKQSFSRSRTPLSTKFSRRKIVSKRHILTVFSSHFIKALIIFRCIYYYYAKTKVENVFAIYFKTNIQIFLFLYILPATHHSLRCWYLRFKVKSGSHKT